MQTQATSTHRSAGGRRIDWVGHLRHLLQTIAFCLGVAALQFAFAPGRPFAIPAVYSLCIGLSTWALIDLGRHGFPSSADTGWPTGMHAVVLPVGGIVAGYLLGTLMADTWFGWSSWGSAARVQLPLSLLVTALAGVGITYYFYSRNKSAWLERRMVEARRQAAEARLKLLETQLEPHMLFNTLANLRALIGTDAERAQQMLDHLIAYLRATLSASRASLHPLSDEFDRLRDYLALMAIRMGPRLHFTLDLPEALAGEPVPALLLQPLVENSIRHGLEPKVAGGRITVSARRDGGNLVLEVADTGAGMAAPMPEPAPNQGFGLAQVRERLATAFEQRFTMDFVAPPQGGFLVTIRFPLKTDNP